MGIVVLLGDSIFDNEIYVPNGPPVIEQLQGQLPRELSAKLIAVDGHTVQGVSSQLENIPKDASHLIVSVGGNDALQQVGVLSQPASSVANALHRLAEVKLQFQSDYRQMLNQLLAYQKPVVVCTIYDQSPIFIGPSPGQVAAATALSIFNDVITLEAVRSGVSILDLRMVCDEPDDYSELSPIEPSVAGGEKIAAAISRIVTCPDLVQQGRSIVFSRKR